VEHEDPHEQIEHAHSHDDSGHSEHSEHSHSEHDHEEEVHVGGDRVAPNAASQIHVSAADLDLRPRFRPADVVEAVPGLFAVQHAGGGKANQYFLRGFDADHGTDVAFFADGVPINLPSHAHGQGFTDLHFVIPELVTGVDGWKGPYYAHLGDFATAGAVDMRFAESFEESRAQLTVGQYGILRGLLIESPKISDTWRAVVAAELARDDGPFVHHEDLTRFNVYGKITHDLSEHSKIGVTWMSYAGKWNGSGQIPARAPIDRFDAIDPSEGGSTQRHMAQVAFESAWKDSDFRAMAYLTRYRFTLYSNFTFFRDDPIHGDEIEQSDDRWTTGLDVRYRQRSRFHGIELTGTLGAQVRYDGIENALRHDQARVPLEDRVRADVSETSLGVFAQEEVKLGRFVRVIGGARADRIDVNVHDQLGSNSGIAGATQLSPKWMAVISPTPELDFFADYGRGFHSNDARGAVLRENPARLITPSTGYEIGARATLFKNLQLSAAAFLIDMDSELVWSGDEGTTEASGATRRMGVELDARWHLQNWLFADASATFTDAKFKVDDGSGKEVPLAPRATFSAGIGARRKFGAFTPHASIRVKAIGDRPATQDGSLTAQGWAIVDADAGLRWKNVELGVDVQNLFDSKWREVSFATTSQLKGEPAPVRDIHFTPGWPLTVMGKATLYWN
jgi:outer membrane cobalamin receptor